MLPTTSKSKAEITNPVDAECRQVTDKKRTRLTGASPSFRTSHVGRRGTTLVSALRGGCAVQPTITGSKMCTRIMQAPPPPQQHLPGPARQQLVQCVTYITRGPPPMSATGGILSCKGGSSTSQPLYSALLDAASIGNDLERHHLHLHRRRLLSSSKSRMPEHDYLGRLRSRTEDGSRPGHAGQMWIA